jgi:transposase, IS5 family
MIVFHSEDHDEATGADRIREVREDDRAGELLADMDRIIPWPEMTAAVATVYPKSSEQGGRPPIPLERLLRIYFLQLWHEIR